MRSLWKGMITFGLVNIPVKLYTARRSKRPSFRLLHKKCNTPLEYERYCPKCKIEVPWEDVVRGYEYEKGKFVVLSDEDFEKIALAKGKTIDVIEFVNLSEVDPIYLDNAYYIEPEETGEKAYLVLLDALKQTGKVAVGKIILKEKEHIVLIRPYGNLLVLHTLFYSDEIIKPDFPFLLKEHKVSRSEVKLAKELINAMSGTLHLEKFKDEYRERLLELIEAKLKGLVPPIEVQREVKATEELMKSLEESLKVVEKKRHKKKHGK